MAVRLNRDSLGTERNRRYNWDEWLEIGSMWQAVQGEDFDCKVQSFVSQLYKAGYDRGLRIHVHQPAAGIVEWEVNEPQENGTNSDAA